MSFTTTLPKQETLDEPDQAQERVGNHPSQLDEGPVFTVETVRPEEMILFDSKSMSTSSLKEVIMSLEEELNQCKQPSLGDYDSEVETDILRIDEERDFPDESRNDHPNSNPESGYLTQSESRAAQRMKSTRKQKRKRPIPKARHLTYSHEKRIQMGFYANKYGVMAMRRKYPGVKESTSRDMRNYVRALVKGGKLSLDEPLENQIIPPKTRNGLPTHSSVANSFCLSSALPGPCSSDTGLNRNQPQTRRKRKLGSLQSPPTETPQILSFEELVKVGFLAVMQGSPSAMKKHNVNETTVKECRNKVIELAHSGKISFEIPLEDQVLPRDPNFTKSAMRKKLSRPRKNVFDQPEEVIQKQPVVVRRMMSTIQNDHQNPSTFTVRVENRPPETKGKSQHVGHINQRVPSNSLNSINGQQARQNNVSLGNDLTFFRWKNRRASLGFQSDQAFAMHLMDVHDAFCGQCSGGGRREHHQNGV